MGFQEGDSTMSLPETSSTPSNQYGRKADAVEESLGPESSVIGRSDGTEHSQKLDERSFHPDDALRRDEMLGSSRGSTDSNSLNRHGVRDVDLSNGHEDGSKGYLDQSDGHRHHRHQVGADHEIPSKGTNTALSIRLESQRGIIPWANQQLNPDKIMVIPLLAISFTTALVDAVTFLAYRTFTTNQTGPTIFLALAAVGDSPGNLLHCGISIACFLFFGLIAGQLGNRYGHKSRGFILSLLLFQLINLTLTTILVSPAGPSSTQVRGYSEWVAVFLLASAGGTQMTMAINLGVPEIATAMITVAYTALVADPHLHLHGHHFSTYHPHIHSHHAQQHPMNQFTISQTPHYPHQVEHGVGLKSTTPNIQSTPDVPPLRQQVTPPLSTAHKPPLPTTSSDKQSAQILSQKRLTIRARNRRIIYILTFWVGAFVGAILYKWSHMWVGLCVAVIIRAAVVLRVALASA